jgi:hypothetical protein
MIEVVNRSRSTAMTTQTAFDAQAFAEFWAAPDPAEIRPELFTEDVAGYWPDGEVHGPEDYTRRLKELLALLPDLRLEVGDYADNGEHIFVRWIMRATGRQGAFELGGVDRIKTRDGLVAENRIYFDTKRFEELSGYALPAI